MQYESNINTGTEKRLIKKYSDLGTYRYILTLQMVDEV